MVKKEDDELKKFVKEKLEKIHELAPMNTELQRWITDKDATQKNQDTQIYKKITGKCTLCKMNPAQYRCIKCKKEVCASHYWILFGLCKNVQLMRQSKNGKKKPLELTS